MQTTSHLLMIRPVSFGYNPQTAVNNSFQVKGDQSGVPEKALQEFDELVGTLRAHEIDVTVVDDSPEPHTPDAIFPNNWISFHENGTLCLYPMYAENRRQERKTSVLESIAKKFPVQRKIDLTHYENRNHFLEGTGSMTVDGVTHPVKKGDVWVIPANTPHGGQFEDAPQVLFISSPIDDPDDQDRVWID